MCARNVEYEIYCFYVTYLFAVYDTISLNLTRYSITEYLIYIIKMYHNIIQIEMHEICHPHFPQWNVICFEFLVGTDSVCAIIAWRYDHVFGVYLSMNSNALLKATPTVKSLV